VEKIDSLISADFLGNYEVTLDAKNRFSFPAEYRNLLGGQILIVTKGIDEGCLYVFTEDRYKQYCDRQLAPAGGKEKKAIRKLKRMLMSIAVRRPLDSQGRLLLPQNILRLVNIEKELIVAGNGDRIELWNKSDWDKEVESFGDISDLYEELE